MQKGKFCNRVIEQFWNSRLKTKMIILFIPVALCCILLVSYTTYYMTSKVLVSYVMDEASLKSQATMNEIETEMLNIRRKEYAIIGNGVDGYETIEEFYDILWLQFAGMGGIKSAIYGTDGRCIYSSAQAFATAYGIKNPDIRQFLSSDKASDFLGPESINDERYIVSVHKTWDMGIHAKYMATYINLSRFYEILAKRGEIVILLDDNGNILEGFGHHIEDTTLKSALQQMKKDRYGKKVHFNGEEYYVDAQKIPYYEWQLITLISASEIKTRLLPVVGVVAFILLGFFLVTIMLFGIVSGIIVRPLQRITKELGNQESKPFELFQFHARYRDEIGQLVSAFKGKEKQIEDYIDKITCLEIKKRQAEVVAFAAQMNPHLLYNTLATIIWLISEDKKHDAITATRSLANLLQDMLRENIDIVPVWKELETLRNYISIQEFRYADKFKHIIYVDNDVLSYMIPRMVLQPLFENAIYHGVKLRETMGLIKVTGCLVDDCIVIEIADNGPADAEKILRLNQLLQSRDMDDLRIGTKNVHMRLLDRYGDGYGLSYEKRGGFTVAVVRFPAEREEGTENV